MVSRVNISRHISNCSKISYTCGLSLVEPLLYAYGIGIAESGSLGAQFISFSLIHSRAAPETIHRRKFQQHIGTHILVGEFRTGKRLVEIVESISEVLRLCIIMDTEKICRPGIG